MIIKRFQAEYSENSITYWPIYEAGKIGIIYLTVLGILFVTTSIWILLDNPSRQTCLETQIALPIGVLALCILLGYIYRTMYKKIVVSNEGIICYKNNDRVEKHILWEDVELVYFRQDSWYGRKSCKIFLKNTSFKSPRETQKCDFAFPVNSVDEHKLLQLVPDCLWANHPWRD